MRIPPSRRSNDVYVTASPGGASRRAADRLSSDSYYDPVIVAKLTGFVMASRYPSFIFSQAHLAAFDRRGRRFGNGSGKRHSLRFWRR